ncbi:hypothetical protein KM043_006616 [Ampulex compressa]|nr:hypothetical protein KM043_006616 [Ampulex compressa]
MTEQETEELRASELGTLDYWEKVYSEELETFKNDGAISEVWFGKTKSMRIVRWIATKLNLDKERDKIIDIGCGNGVMLVELAEKGFRNLMGVDYSQNAVDLSREILKDAGFPNVSLELCDILDLEKYKLPTDFAIVHDKGTYDAISMYRERSVEERQKYIENVYSILLPEGHLILTSCNWTKKELEKHFEDRFEIFDELPMDTYQFGGKSGCSVTQLVFKKKLVT